MLMATFLQSIHRRAWETVQLAQRAGTPIDCLVERSVANEGCCCVLWRETYGMIYAAFARDPDSALMAKIDGWLERTLAARAGWDVYCQVCGDNVSLAHYLQMHGFRLDSAGFELRYGGSVLDITPHPDLIPRPYAAAHLDVYLALLDAAFAPLRRANGWTLAEFARHRERLARRWDAKSNRGDFAAFWTGETLVGLYDLNRDTLNLLVVHPEVQRQGYGTALLHHAVREIRETRGYPSIYLNVVENNHTALAFYQHHGFTLTGHYREYTYCP